jgi:ribose transport system substrate-binding protein
MTRSLRVTKRKLALLAVPTAAALLVGACSSSPGSSGSSGNTSSASTSAYKTEKINVGDGKTITVHGPIHLAYFSAGSDNAYLLKVSSALQAQVAKYPGATVSMFDPEFDAQTELMMVQNAITSGKYNAFFINAVDGVDVCNLLTVEAPAHNIAVVNVASPLCAGRALLPSPEQHWAPGTVAIIDNSSIDFMVDWYTWMAKQNPGPQKVIVVEGPQPHTTTPINNTALAIVQKSYPNFQVIAVGHTDWSELQGFTVTQSLLKAHPNATIVMGIYSDITLGVVKAIQQAGLQGKIKVYDRGGSSAIIQDIKQGLVQATTPNYPVGSAVAAMAVLQKAFMGQPFSHVILNEGGPVPAGSSTGMLPIDSANVASFVPQY